MLELSHICVCFDINWLVLMAWLHKFSNFQQRSYKTIKMSLHLWVSHQVVSVGPPAYQGWQGQQVEVVGGPWWPFLYSLWENLPRCGFFWGPSSSLEALCSKYSVVSRCQQVVVFSVVFECCMIIHELCTDVETVSGRTWPCIIRTWTVLVVWRSDETVLVV